MSGEMSREQAIKWLKTFKGNTGMTELSQAFDVAIAALSAEPMRWIPVTERLPENSGEYLVSVVDGDYQAVGIVWFAHQKDYAIVRSEWRELGEGEEVIAWMPKPEHDKESGGQALKWIISFKQSKRWLIT